MYDEYGTRQEGGMDSALVAVRGALGAGAARLPVIAQRVQLSDRAVDPYQVGGRLFVATIGIQLILAACSLLEVLRLSRMGGCAGRIGGACSARGGSGEHNPAESRNLDAP